jgi:hypothetical protein
MPNHHGALYRTYRWTSTFITVPVCIWVEPFSDLYAFRGATIEDLRAHVPVPEAGDIVRGFWVRPHHDLLMVGWGRVVAVVYDQEINLADFFLGDGVYGSFPALSSFFYFHSSVCFSVQCIERELELHVGYVGF